MATKCASLIKACRIRLTRVDSCGVPVVGPKSVITSSGFVSVSAASDIEEGEEYLQKNACGDPCINEKDDGFLKRVNLTTQWCLFDPDAVEMITRQRLLLDSEGNAIGVAAGESPSNGEGYSLELWQKIAGGECSSVAANEVQTVRVTPGGVPSGTFTLTFGGQTTAPIAYNATAGDIQTALEALSNVDPGDIVATGGPVESADVVLTFGGQYANLNVSQITADDAGLTDATVATATTTEGSTGGPDWMYWTWPFISGSMLGDLTFENGAFLFDTTGYTKKISAADQWGAGNRGPFGVLPATAPLEIGDHYANIITSVQPPASACGAVALAAA